MFRPPNDWAMIPQVQYLPHYLLYFPQCSHCMKAEALSEDSACQNREIEVNI